MALSVRTNVASIRAASMLNRTQGSLSSFLERISSGLRVNRAADDAAGLSVASRMNLIILVLNKPFEMQMMVYLWFKLLKVV
jgi:flagellin